MANKKTIHQLEAEIDRYWRQLRILVRKIDERRDLIRKIRMGKVKQPPPPGVKVKLSTMTPAQVAEFGDDLSDIASGYGGDLVG